jgi:hypothetical protein
MTSEFQPDCSRCPALCCMALAFDRGPAFAFDKPAGVACRNLAPDFACTVHARLDEGFAGCRRYTCHGAGQLVGAMFGGASWRDRPALAAPMIEAFGRLREIQDMRAQLAAARDLPLAADDRATLAELALRLAPAGGWSREALAAFDLGAARDGFRRFLGALRRRLAPSLAPAAAVRP